MEKKNQQKTRLVCEMMKLYLQMGGGDRGREGEEIKMLLWLHSWVWEHALTALLCEQGIYQILV